MVVEWRCCFSYVLWDIRGVVRVLVLVGVWGCVGGVKWCIVGGWWEDMRGL